MLALKPELAQSQAKGCWQTTEAGKNKQQTLLKVFREKEHSPADTFSEAQ
jgi:hypothetical protein